MKAALKNADSLQGKRVLEATDYYTPEDIVEIFRKVTGKKAAFIQVTPGQYRASLPELLRWSTSRTSFLSRTLATTSERASSLA